MRRIAANMDLQRITHHLKRLGIRYMLDGGTLLGAFKQEDFFRDDKDVDLTSFECHVEKIPELVDTLAAERFEVLRWRNHPEGTDQLTLKRKVVTDIMFKKREGDFCVWTLYRRNAEGKILPSVRKAVPAHFCTTLELIPLRGKLYPAPALTREYLEYRYGDISRHKTAEQYQAATHDLALLPKPTVTLIPDWTNMTVQQVLEAAGEDGVFIQDALNHERSHKQRKSLITALEAKL